MKIALPLAIASSLNQCTTLLALPVINTLSQAQVDDTAGHEKVTVHITT